MKKKFSIIIIIILSVFLLFSCDSRLPDTTGEKVEANNPAPDFSIELLSGETVSLSDFLGKVVFINFWATWCGPCVEEMPDIQQLAETYPDDVVVIAINCSERKDKVEDFIYGRGYTFHVGLDDGVVQSLYPTRGIPYTVIVDANGNISQTHLGGGAGMFPKFEEYVKAAMGINN